MMNKKSLALYLHIPFCVRKCLYCDFLSAPPKEEEKENYVKALVKDCRTSLGALAEEYHLSSIFIGGGTPSLLRGGQIKEILSAVFASIEVEETAEITMEANPGTIDGEKLYILREAGVNRLSFGLQSVIQEELEALGRIHTYRDFTESFLEARKAGFSNINVDLMYNLPGQTKETWEKSLKSVMELQPEHISAYSLIIEEGTPFFQFYKERKFVYPDENLQEEIDRSTQTLMEQYGYLQYEISNYAKEGYACRHNLVYWKRGEYLGLGLGAASLLKEERFCRTRNLKEYQKQAESGRFQKEDRQQLTKKEAMEEYMFLGLRMNQGISIKGFFSCFGISLEGVYGKTIARLKREGFLEEKMGNIRLTKRGQMVANPVMAEFIGQDF